jgi:hypothetical protein
MSSLSRFTALSSSRKSWVALVAVLQLLGCGGEAPQQLVQLRDSAGVAIIENSAAAEVEVDRWRVPDSPVLEIGVSEGAAEYQLDNVRSALRLADGRIVVANAGTHEIRFYDRAGRFIRSVGREGAGPGEFRSITWLRRFATDSLAVFDRRSLRITIFDDDGELIRSLNVAQLPGITFPNPIGLFDDGKVLVNSPTSPDQGSSATRIIRDPVTCHLVDSDGRLIGSVGDHPGMEYYRATLRGQSVGMPLPFGKMPQFEVFKDRFFVGASDAYEIGIYGEDGTLRRLIRLDQENAKLAAEEIERYRRMRLERARTPEARQRVERELNDVPFPETMPAYGPIMADREGNLWVRQYLPPAGDPTHWRVFDAEGRLLALVETPGGFLPLEMGSDYVLGRWRDGMSVEYVRMYVLHKRSYGNGA